MPLKLEAIACFLLKSIFIKWILELKVSQDFKDGFYRGIYLNKILRKIKRRECIKCVVNEFIRDISVDEAKKLIVVGKCQHTKIAVRLLKHAGMNCIEIHTKKDFMEYLEKKQEMNVSQKLLYLLLTHDYKRWINVLEINRVDRRNIIVLFLSRS